MSRLRIGLLGCGTVGRGFVLLVERERPRIRARFGINLEITGILVRDITKHRPGVDRALLTTSAMEVIDSDCDLVVELVGGVHSAGAYLRRALSLGKPVVTANKSLLASAGSDLLALATAHEATIGFEASVCGCIPILRVLREGLAGESIESITGILNGTCNYVLTRMEDEGLSFDAALAEAQALGFAEADPSLDISGADAEQKIRIVSEIAFGEPVIRARVSGIETLTPEILHSAARRGQRIRLIAESRRTAGGVALEVAPRELPRDHALAGVSAEENGILIHGAAIGEMLLRGKGAGSMPTAVAVLSDVIEAARRSSRANAERWEAVEAVRW